MIRPGGAARALRANKEGDADGSSISISAAQRRARARALRRRFQRAPADGLHAYAWNGAPDSAARGRAARPLRRASASVVIVIFRK